MPINCPLPFGEVMRCHGCRHNTNEKCWWFYPARPLLQILTTDERVEELHERLLLLEERIGGLSDKEIRRLGLKHIWDEVRELKQSLHFTYKRIGEQIRAKRKPQKKRIKTTEM